jgi:hypothetical protein
MSDFNLENWLEQQADKWANPDQASIVKSSCLKGFNKALDLVIDKFGHLPKGTCIDSCEAYDDLGRIISKLRGDR